MDGDIMKNIFKKSRIRSYVAIALIALLIGLVIGVKNDVTPFTRAEESETEQPQEQVKMDESESAKIPEENVFADIAARVDSGVVLVTSEVEAQNGHPMEPFFNDPFFKRFFGDQFEMPDEPKTREGFGSGFIVSEDGYIITNEHVIHNAVKVEVTLKGHEKPVPAEVVWSEFQSDLAVIKIDEEKLEPIKMGDSDTIKAGDWAIAIGNPFGFEHTVTTGVISALGRPINIPTQDGQYRSYPNLIQTDAAINPGNSGGPLLNINGEVIGINTAVSAQGQGIGFAIPINEVKNIVKDLKEKGEIVRPWLGIYYGEMETRLKEQYKDYYGIKELNGVMIGKVIEDSPAEEAGLRPNDIITRMDDKKIDVLNDVQKIIDTKEIGDTIKIEIIRDGYTKTLFVDLVKRPNNL